MHTAPKCRIKGCEHPKGVQMDGLCVHHHARAIERQARYDALPYCSHDGCTKRTGRGLCDEHAQEQAFFDAKKHKMDQLYRAETVDDLREWILKYMVQDD